MVKHQVSKDIVVAALITDTRGQVLIMKPTHKDGWILPGGYVEVGESPSRACRREIEAELGVIIDGPDRLLSVDYRGQTDEYVMFIFDGGVFADETVATIQVPPQYAEYRFMPPAEALTLLRANSARRLLPTLEARQGTGTAYLEDQQPF